MTKNREHGVSKNRMEKDNGSRVQTKEGTQTQLPWTHGAIPLDSVKLLLKFFTTTPMAYDVADPFVQMLSRDMVFLTLQPQKPKGE